MKSKKNTFISWLQTKNHYLCTEILTSITMKKAFLAIVMSVIMIVMASCGGNSHSKAFNESKKIIDKISESLKQAKTCDDLDVAAFGILGLLGVEGIDAISETEQQQLSELTEKMQNLMEQKKEELECDDDDFWGSDDETPLDEPFDEEE